MATRTSFGQPGGNPANKGGRPKGLARLLRAEIEAVRERMHVSLERGDDDKRPTDIMDGYRAIFRRLWAIAMEGEDKDSLVAIKILYERTDGAPRQVVELEAPATRARIDWSAKPAGMTDEQWAQRRRELLAAHEEMRSLAQAVEVEPIDDIEH